MSEISYITSIRVNINSWNEHAKIFFALDFCPDSSPDRCKMPEYAYKVCSIPTSSLQGHFLSCFGLKALIKIFLTIPTSY